jgi:hypothetical protein
MFLLQISLSGPEFWWLLIILLIIGLIAVIAIGVFRISNSRVGSDISFLFDGQSDMGWHYISDCSTHFCRGGRRYENVTVASSPSRNTIIATE